MISTVTNRSSTLTSTSENQFVKEFSNIPDKAVEQTSDKSNTVASLTLNDPLSSLRNSNDNSSLISDTDKRSSHLKPFLMSELSDYIIFKFISFIEYFELISF